MVKNFLKICLVAILLALPIQASSVLRGSYTAAVGCDIPTSRTGGSTQGRKLAEGSYSIEGQSFLTTCGITNGNVTVDYSINRVDGSGTTDAEFWISTDQADIYGSAACSNTSGNTVNTTGNHSITFTSCSLSDATTYWFVIGSTASSANAIYPNVSNTAGYSGGQERYGSYSTGNLSTTLGSSYDMDFQVRIGDAS